MPAASWRVFAAVELPASVRALVDAAAGELRPRAPELRWTHPDDWHLTLAFLGAVPRIRVAALADVCAEVAAAGPTLELALTGRAGTFGRRVLWAGCEGSEPLDRLAQRLRVALDAAGFPMEDRPFHAHLTLARARRGGQVPQGLAEAYRGPAARWAVPSIALLRSVPGGVAGARYAGVGAWALRGTDG